MASIDKVVYRDQTYPTSWIKDSQSSEIATHLNDKGFITVGAKGLERWMQDHISTDSCEKAIVVFAQDVMPDTIVHESGPYTLVRQFLDFGGRIVWIGDIPLWYQGIENREKNEWRFKGPLNVLGIIQLYGFPKSAIRFSWEASDLRLRRRWTGIRPIAKDETITEIAISHNWATFNFLQLEEKTRLGRIWDSLSSLQKIRISASPTNLAVDLEKLKEISNSREPLQKNNTKNPNGWAKKYHSSPFGFVRIWDTMPSVVSPGMLGDLYRVATYDPSQYPQ